VNLEEAKELMKGSLAQENLRKHCIAVSAIMRGIAKELGRDEEEFALAGMLHDIDFEQTKEAPEKHGILAAKTLEGKVNERILHAIMAHNFEHTGVRPETELDYALIVSDALSGLVVATALVMPDKKLASISRETLKRKFKQKDFARRCNREHILYCEKIGIPLERLFEIALDSMKEVAAELGL